MKHFLILLALTSTVQAQTLARITRVVDGDTYYLQAGSKLIDCRLAKVDAPELNQHYGYTAFQQVEQLLIGKLVMFDTVSIDQYKRVVVKMTLNGKRVDSLLIRSGFAWYNSAYGLDAILSTAMVQAISLNLGLWSCGVTKVCPPWLFRRYDYRNKLKYCKGC